LAAGLVEARDDSLRIFATTDGIALWRQMQSTPRGVRAANADVVPPYLAKVTAEQARDARVRAGLTQEQLAAALGRSHGYVSGKENGDSAVDDAYLRTVREAGHTAERIHVRSVRARKGYRIALTFSDGSRGTADLSKRIERPSFAPVREPAMFARVFVDHGVVSWPCGVSISSETLHSLAFPPSVGETMVALLVGR
jgi:transcriptional regulator with XRE-family HTH domain